MPYDSSAMIERGRKNRVVVRLRALLWAGLVVSLTCQASLAQDREFAFGIGYGHLFWDGSHTDELEEQGGFVMNGRVSWALTPDARPERPQLRAGVGLDLAFYTSHEDNGDDFVIIGDDVIITTADDYTQLTSIAPQVEIAWRQPVIDEHWYVEPGLAGVFMIGNYTTGQEFFWFVDQDENRWNVGGGGKAFLRLAYTKDRWAVGAEGSYSYGWLDFGDDIGGDIQQAYLGLFFSHKF